MARIESLVVDGLSDAFEDVHTTIYSELENLLGTESQITEGLDAISSAVHAFNAAVSMWQKTLCVLAQKYPEIVVRVETMSLESLLCIIEGCFKLVQEKAGIITDRESARGVWGYA